MVYKEFTGQDIIDAIKKNTIKWGKGSFFRNSHNQRTTIFQCLRTKDQIGAACVLGIAAINLNIEPIFHAGMEPEGYLDVLNSITKYNDTKAKSFEQVAKYAEKKLKSYADQKFRAPAFHYESYITRTDTP